MTFTPSALGSRTATLAVTGIAASEARRNGDSDPTQADSWTIALTGTGVAQADLTLSSGNFTAAASAATPSNAANGAGSASSAAAMQNRSLGRPVISGGVVVSPPSGRATGSAFLPGGFAPVIAPVAISPATLTCLLATPLVAFIYVGALGRWIFLDVLYGLGVLLLAPALLLYIFR